MEERSEVAAEVGGLKVVHFDAPVNVPRPGGREGAGGWQGETGGIQRLRAAGMTVSQIAGRRIRVARPCGVA